VKRSVAEVARRRGMAVSRGSHRALVERGYSLVELAVALAMFGVLLAAGVSGFRSAVADEEVDGWARSVSFDVSTARQTAVTDATTVAVTVTESSYLIATMSGVTLKRATLPAGIAMSTTCPVQVCAFDRRGIPTTAGTITITHATTARSHMITIQPTTGNVSYQ
jgi:prepilin-type N-terminal cleavage/methylation domain-containing protein